MAPNARRTAQLMSGFTLTSGRPTLADNLIARSLPTDFVLIAAGAALTSIAAQFVLPLWPVPITGQSFAVLFLGSMLGALRGALSIALYLALGSFGLPVFAGGGSGNLFTYSSGGFIVGFVFAAAFTGWLAQRNWDHRVVSTLASFLGGTVIIYAFGLPWLYAVLSTYPATTLLRAFHTVDVVGATLDGGLLPFILGDILKIVVAAVVLPLIWKLVNKRLASTL
jgi:biotin transport system substrate-specific component